MRNISTSTSRLVICTDIFGQTPQLDTLLSDAFARNGQLTSCTLEICSPFGQDVYFSHEQSAYQAFKNAGGIHSYSEKVRAVIGSANAQCTLVGFSAGGAAAYNVSASLGIERIFRLIAFYPGQIRFMTELLTDVPSLLVFAQSEPHSNVAELAAHFGQQSDVTCKVSRWQHGYMNRLSPNFSAEGYQAGCALLSDALS